MNKMMKLSPFFRISAVFVANIRLLATFFFFLKAKKIIEE